MTTIDQLLEQITRTLREVPGAEAVVLGGSRARGTAHAHSDVDIGLYYDAQNLDLPALNRAAATLDAEHRPDLVGPPGSWGPWVNAGGWLQIHGHSVDWILRDLERVRQVVRETGEGKISIYYQVGHPHGYVNAMYRGELAVCLLLWDQTGQVRTLKREAEEYPEPMRRSLVRRFFFEAEFSLQNAAKGRAQDLYYRAAQVLRALSCLNQVLFAFNREYCLNEKGAVALIDGFPIAPEAYSEQTAQILSRLGSSADRALRLAQDLARQVRSLISEETLGES